MANSTDSMFAIVYAGDGPDAFPQFDRASAVTAKIFKGYGVAFFYRGTPPNKHKAETIGRVLSIQLVENDCRVVLPNWVHTGE